MVARATSASYGDDQGGCSYNTCRSRSECLVRRKKRMRGSVPVKCASLELRGGVDASRSTGMFSIHCVTPLIRSMRSSVPQAVKLRDFEQCEELLRCAKDSNGNVTCGPFGVNGRCQVQKGWPWYLYGTIGGQRKAPSRYTSLAR